MKCFHTFPSWHWMTMLDHVGSSISDLTSHSSRKKFIFTGLLAGGAYYFIKAWCVFVAHGHQHKQVVGSHRWSCPKSSRIWLIRSWKSWPQVRDAGYGTDSLVTGEADTSAQILPTICENLFFLGEGQAPVLHCRYSNCKERRWQMRQFCEESTSFR